MRTHNLRIIKCMFEMWVFTISSRVGRRDCGVSWCSPLPPLLPLPLPPLLFWRVFGTEFCWWNLWVSPFSEKWMVFVEQPVSLLVAGTKCRWAGFSWRRSLVFCIEMAKTENRVVGWLQWQSGISHQSKRKCWSVRVLMVWHWSFW